MRRDKAPNQTNTSYETKSHFGIKAAIVLGGIAAASVVSLTGGTGEAHAANQLVFGGRYDVDSQELTRHLIDTHQINPATDHIFNIKSPGGVVKDLDGASMVDSANVMVSDADNVLATKIAPNEQTNLWSYSLGTLGALLTADKHQDIVDSVTADKSWLGPGGLGSSELAKRPDIKGLLAENGIIANVPIPTAMPVRFISNTNDAISAGAGFDELGQVAGSFMGSFDGPHDMDDPSQQPREVQHYGNVTVAWYGDSPIPTLKFDPIQLPSVQDLLAQFQPPAPTDIPSVPEALLPAPDMQPVPEVGPVFLASDTAPAPEAAPEVPAPEMVPAPVDDAPAPEAPAPDMELAPAA